jgi:hypothetical protein
VSERRRISVELLLGISATLLSLCALVVTVVQTQIFREQQRASVWPYLQIGNSRLDQKFTLAVENKGVGPAVIKRVEVSYRGKAYADHVAVLNPELVNFTGARFFARLRPGDVVKAGEEMRLFQIDRDNAKADRLSAIVDDPTFLLRITYADVYKNCWLTDPQTVTALSRCP